MAVSHVIAQADGNEVRSAMTLINMDGLTSFLTGTVIGATIATALKGTPVDASAALAYTSVATLTPRELMDNLVETLQAALTGATVRFSQNEGTNQYVLHIEAIAQVADSVDVSLPVFTPGV